jgi:hypothetical protein
VRAAPMFLAGGLVFVALWWTTARAWEFFAGRSGEIEAWLIANVHTTRNTWVQVIVDVVLFVVRYVVGGAMWAAAIAAGVSRHRLTTTSTFLWLRAGLSRRLVGATAMLNVVLIFLPLRGLYWRPEDLPSTWVEPAFVGTKLALIYLCLNSAIALTLKMALIETQRNTATETSRRPATESRAPAPPGNTEAPARTQP